MNNSEQQPKVPSCTLSNEELIKRCNEWVYKLAETGGKAWTLRIPVDFNNDPDILFTELGTRLAMKEGQTQEPVGGMKFEDVQILAKKHAEHIIEMGWRDNPDKDDIIADFISGYVSATPPDVEAFSKRVIDSLQRFYELGDETGYSNSELSRIRSCIEKVKEIKAGYAVPSPVGIDVEALAKQKAKEKYPGEMNMMGYKINAQKNNQEKFIEGFKAGYSASLPQSSTEESDIKKKAADLVYKIVEQWGNAAGPSVDDFVNEMLSLSAKTTYNNIEEERGRGAIKLISEYLYLVSMAEDINGLESALQEKKWMARAKKLSVPNKPTVSSSTEEEKEFTLNQMLSAMIEGEVIGEETLLDGIF